VDYGVVEMRILLADDHRLLIEGLTSLLAAYEIEVVGIANDGMEAVRLAHELKPDVILMDIRMPGCDGFVATRLIKAKHPEIHIVMLTTSDDDEDLFESVRSGASGYLLKSMSGDAFVEALKGIEHGAPPFSAGLAARVIHEFARLSEPPKPESKQSKEPDEANASLLYAGLTERQSEVLNLVASGLTYKEVGLRLRLSERTIRYHMKEILEHMHAKHRNQVIAYAHKMAGEDAASQHEKD
jgi:DNA-binding NarL/FixJ family response regulator